MKSTDTPGLLPHDCTDQCAREGDDLVSRWVHDARCGLRRGDACSCVKRNVYIRRKYARRYEQVKHERA